MFYRHSCINALIASDARKIFNGALVLNFCVVIWYCRPVMTPLLVLMGIQHSCVWNGSVLCDNATD